MGPEKTTTLKAVPGGVGGQLYPRFRKWFTAAVAAVGASDLEESDVQAHERKTAVLLKRMHDFAIEYFKNSVAGKTPAGYLEAPTIFAKDEVPTKWRCTRCCFPNDASATMCTACCQKRPPR